MNIKNKRLKVFIAVILSLFISLSGINFSSTNEHLMKFGPQVVHAAGAPVDTLLSSLTAGDYISYGGYTWRILDPSTRYIMMENNLGNRLFDPNDAGGNYYFDPSDSNNIAYYLNNGFYNGLSNNNWIVSYNYGTGHQVNENLFSQNANVALISYSEWNSYKAMLGVPTYNFWFRTFYTPNPFSVYLVRTDSVVTAPLCSQSSGTRPVVHLKTTIKVMSGSGTLGSPYVLKDNVAPIVSITSPTTNRVFSTQPGYNTFTINGTVSDQDNNDKNYILYNFDGGANTFISMASGSSGNDGHDYITANTTNLSFTSNSINIPALSDGAHTLNIISQDDKGGTSTATSINCNIDNTAPGLNAITLIRNISPMITVQGSAYDPNINGYNSGLDPTPYIFNRDGADIGSWRVSLTDSPLTPNTLYTYKYKARDKVGNVSNYSQTVSMYTYAVTFGSPVFDDATKNSISFEWYDGGNPAGTTYEIYCTNTASTIYSGTGLNFTHSGLTGGSNYTYRARAINHEGIPTDYSSDFTYWLAATPNNLTIDNVTDNSLRANWSNNGNPGLTIYDVELVKVSDGSTVDTWTTVSTNYTFNGLSPNTQYYFKVKTKVNGTNWTDFATSSNINTLALNPTAVTVTSSSATSMSVDITNNVANTTAPSHLVEIKLKGAGISGAVVSSSGWSTSTSRVINGLQDDIEYEVWVTTRNNDNVENTSVNYVSSIFTNKTPVLYLTNSSGSYIISTAAGHNQFSLTGKAYDLDNESVTASASIDSVQKIQVVNPAPTSTPGADNISLSWNGAELSEGSYTNVPLTVTDAKGTSTSVIFTGTLIVDNTLPLVTITSSSSVDIDLNTAFVDPGATAWDNTDGDITSNIVTLNNIDVTTTGAYTVQYYVYDSAGNQSLIKIRNINVHNYGQEILNTIDAADIQANKRIILPTPATGQAYSVVVSDTDTLAVLLNTTSGAATISLPFVEGHRYTLIINSTNIGVSVASRTINVTSPDITPPVINGAYILNSNLYVLANDNYLLHSKAYAFTMDDGTGNTVILSEISGGGFVTVVGVVNNTNTQNSYYDTPNFITVSTMPNTITIFVRDSFGNITSQFVNLTSDNAVVYGVVSAGIQAQIDAANAPAQASNGGTGTPLAIDQPQQEIIINQDMGINVTSEVTSAVNSALSDNYLSIANNETQDASNFTVNIISGIMDIQRAIEANGIAVGASFRLDVFEKVTNQLVYTKSGITNPESIIIPNLQDSSMYVIRINVMVNNQVLGFRDVIKETADKTTPVIEQVVLSNTSYGTDMVVYATDNKALANQAYSYTFTDENGVSYNPLMYKASFASSNSDGGWYTDTWTVQNKLMGLDGVKKVRVRVRDTSGNITQQIVDIASAGKDNTINSGINSNNPLNIGIGNSSIGLAELLRDLTLNMDINRINSINAIKAKIISLDLALQRSNIERSSYKDIMKQLYALLDQLSKETDPKKFIEILNKISELLKQLLALISTNNNYSDILSKINDLTNYINIFKNLPYLFGNGSYSIDDYEVTSDDPEIADFDSNGLLVAKKEGTVTLSIKNKKTGLLYKYCVQVGLINFDRRIIVEVGSQFDLRKAFNIPLLRVFGKNSYTVSTEDSGLYIDNDGIITALSPGLRILYATDGKLVLKIYVIVAKDVYPVSEVKSISQNMTMTIKVGEVIDIRDNTSLFKFGEQMDSAKTDFMITEALSDNVTIINNCMIRADKPGVAKFIAIDLVTKKNITVEMLVEEFNPADFEDIEDDTYVDSIKYLANKGLIKGNNGKYNSSETATVEQFLTILNRIMVYKGTYNGEPLSTPELKCNFVCSDWSKYDVTRILSTSGVQEAELIFGENLNLKQSLNKGIIKNLFTLKGIKFDVDRILGSNTHGINRGILADVYAKLCQDIL